LGDSTEGLLSVVRGGNCRFGQGSVIDTQNAGSNEKFIRIAQDAKFSFDGPVTCRGLEAKSFSVEGGNVFVEGGVDVIDTVLFYDVDGGTASCAGAFTFNLLGEGSGGASSLPALNGAITGTYGVSATKAAYIRYSTTSSLTTASGTNTVSADAGATLSSRNEDGTIIIGATPSFSAGFSGTIKTATSPLTADMTLYENFFIDTTAAAKTVNLPDSTGLGEGAELVIKDYKGNAAANNITITPFGTDTIEGAASLPINTNYGAYRLSKSGTDWVIVSKV
jgi:hypothetical protein